MKANLLFKKASSFGLLIVLLCSFSVLKTDKPKIEGTVYDEFKKPLSNVEIQNTTNSFVTFSDTDGHFIIRGKSGDALKFIFPSKPIKQIKASTVKGLKVYFDDQSKLDAIAEAKEKKENRKANRIAERRNKRYWKHYKNVVYTAKIDHIKHPNPYKKAVIGTVSDQAGMSLPGVNVVIKGTTKGTQTDIDGNYGIDAKIGDELVFSFIGMKQAVIKVTESTINVTLQDDSMELSEVVTTAYKTTRPKTVPGLAITEIKDKAIAKSESKIIIRGAASIATEKGEESDKAVSDDKKSTKAGQLTAGEVNDFSKFEYWEDLTKDQLNQWQKLWVMSPTFRYSILLTNKQGYPIINKIVHLVDEGGAKLWTSRTDNTGRAELWYKPNDISIDKVAAKLHIMDDTDATIIKNPKEFREGINTFSYQEKCNELQKVNIAFMVDATGSMGDEIQYLQAELNDVISRTKKALPSVDLSMGSVFYRDFSDDYLVKTFDFTTKIPDVISFIKRQYASGGGDYPEAVTEAYEAAIDNMSWDDEARAKLLFVVLDAPPHYSAENVVKLQNLAKRASEKGIRIIPIAASGIDKSTEYLMRSMALQTNGTYLFITNHSGIGNNHIEPSTDSYKVEMLNDLILRVILQFTAVNECDQDQNELQKNTKIEEQLTNDLSIKWSIFPNPTTGLATVDLDHEANELFLFDTTGKLVLYEDKKTNQYQIDLSGLPNAIYYLKVNTEEKSLFGKIIKKM